MGAGQSRNSANRRAHHLTEATPATRRKQALLKTVSGQAVVHMERVKLAPSQLQVGSGLTNNKTYNSEKRKIQGAICVISQ